jgi:electron transfer flavoprotein alpha subunit
MDFLVLVKVVPPSESLRYDPALGRVIREGTELVVNPFDQRALRVALELRRSGETVTVLSLGPPHARVPLRETRALGVDRVVLLTDPAFAGSDTLATARALSAAAQRMGHDVTLGGAWTTDSETGQVGPEVAALLGVPVVSGARALRRDADGPGFDVTVDTPTGWAEYRARAPLLVTVGEKIAKPLRATPEALARVPDPAVEVLGTAELGLHPQKTGTAGSPTVVGSVAEVAPTRSPRRFAEGAPSERVHAAVAALTALLGAPRPGPLPLPPAPSPMRPEAEVLVLVTGSNGDLDPAALGLLSEVRRALPGSWPSAVWVGPPPTEAATHRLDLAGALAGYCVTTREPRPESSQVARGFESSLEARPSSEAGLFLSDPFGREVAGQLAARRGLGLIGDAIGMRSDPTRGIVWSKPSFGGRTVAGIYSRTRPSLATIRPGAFALAPESRRGEGFGWRNLPALRDRNSVELRAEGVETLDAVDLERREVVVVVGMGVGGPEGIERLRPTLARWQAGLVGTRRVVDAGWLPRQLQLGLTGRSLAPRLGVLLGVSGSPNHLIGWKRAGTLLAVNRDPEAPVFREADVGVVGSVEEVVPLLEAPLAGLVGR